MRQFNYIRAPGVTSVNGQTGDVVIEAGGGGGTQVSFESKILTPTDISNQYVDVLSPIQGIPWIGTGRVVLEPGVDFTVSGNRISFIGPVAVGGLEALVPGDRLSIYYGVQPVSGVLKIQYVTVDSIQEINKAISLPFPVTDPNGVMVDVLHGGGSLYREKDFYIDGSVVKWDGMRVDGLIAEGDEIRVAYASSPSNIYYITISFSQALAKEIVLGVTPANPSAIQVDVLNGGGALYLDRDFFVTGNIISWSGGRLDSILSEGDEIRVCY